MWQPPVLVKVDVFKIRYVAFIIVDKKEQITAQYDIHLRYAENY